MAGLYSPNGSGPFHSSGSFRSSGISSYPSGSPVVRSPPPVVSGSGPDAGLRSSAAGFVCSRTGVGVSTIGAASAFSVRSTSLAVLGSSPVALLSACEDSGRPWSLRKLIREAASSTPLTGAHITASTILSWS